MGAASGALERTHWTPASGALELTVQAAVGKSPRTAQSSSIFGGVPARTRREARLAACVLGGARARACAPEPHFWIAMGDVAGEAPQLAAAEGLHCEAPRSRARAAEGAAFAQGGAASPASGLHTEKYTVESPIPSK